MLVSLGFVFVFEFSFVLVVAFVLVYVFAFFLIVFVWSDHLINCRRTDGTVIGCSVAAVAWRRRRIFRICNLLCLYLPIFFYICNYICNIQHLSVFTLMALEFVIKRQININVPEILCKRVRGLRHKCKLLNWVAIIHYSVPHFAVYWKVKSYSKKYLHKYKPNPHLWLNTFMYAEPTSCASFVRNFNIEEIQNQYLCTQPFPDVTTEIPYPRNRTWQENDGWGNKWSMLWYCTFTFYQCFIRPCRLEHSCNKYSKLQKSLKAVETWSLKHHNNLENCTSQSLHQA